VQYSFAGFLLPVVVMSLLACGEGAPPPAGEDGAARAKRLAREILIVDTHVDVPYRLVEKMEDISVRTESGDFDYPRARAGGLDAPFMSIYVPADLQEKGEARDYADRLIDMVEKFETDWPDKFAIARSPAEVRRLFSEGIMALPMGMENGAPIEDDLANVAHFHQRGIRYITLAHSKNNQICDSSYEKEHKWKGLSPFGREVVKEMNRVGIMIDVSHLTDATVRQIMELTGAPVIASHSSCRKFTPGWERNMDDESIRLLGRNGGVIQINFGSAFLDEAANRQSVKLWDDLGAFREQNGLTSDHPRVQEFRDEYYKDSPKIYAELSVVVDHIDHVVKLVGIDHVGLGSDFDGVGDSLPAGLKDVSGYPNLIRALLERGYSEQDIRKICGENLLRVWSEVEWIAANAARRNTRTGS
jgi:membrane dipeptidase